MRTLISRPSSSWQRNGKETLGRVGLVGRGVLFGIIGLLAVQLAAGDANSDTTSAGAVEWLAGQPLGRFLLVALTVSLFSLAAWRTLDAAVGDPVEGHAGRDRVRFAVQALVYLALAVGALTATTANWSGRSSSGTGAGAEEQATATVLAWPGGQWIVVGVGLTLIGVAVYQFKTHVMDQEFTERLGTAAPSGLTALGRFGYAARSLVYVMVGSFLVQAGLSYEPDKADGLSGALQELSGQGWGQVLLWATAIGLLGFGVFTVAEAKYRPSA